ncbi:MAG: hypothetical protein FWD57_00360 [Polyangiaceae bacterium]|nr:hypothetical protein [Polyangiaceae bacterium]
MRETAPETMTETASETMTETASETMPETASETMPATTSEPTPETASDASVVPTGPPPRWYGKKARTRGPSFSFTDSFPRDPELNKLVSAFAEGRYDIVRKQAPELAASTTDPHVARAAMELRSRIDADPTAVRLFISAFVLLAMLTAWVYLSHTH